MRYFTGRQSHYFVSLAYDSGCHLTTESPEVEVRTKYILYRKAEITKVIIAVDMDCFQKIEQGKSFIPRSSFRLIHHIVSIECGQWNTSHIGNPQGSYKLLILCYNLIEALFRKIYQVHLVDSQHYMLDSQQRYQKCMTSCLSNYSHTGIYQNNSQIGGRTAGYHITGILFVPRSISNDKFTVIGRKVAISHINRNALFTLCFQAIQQQGIINVFAGIAQPLAITLQCIKLILIQFFAIEQQTSDQCRLSVIYRTCCQQTKQILLFILIQKCFYI